MTSWSCIATIRTYKVGILQNQMIRCVLRLVILFMELSELAGLPLSKSHYLDLGHPHMPIFPWNLRFKKSYRVAHFLGCYRLCQVYSSILQGNYQILRECKIPMNKRSCDLQSLQPDWWQKPLIKFLIIKADRPTAELRTSASLSSMLFLSCAKAGVCADGSCSSKKKKKKKKYVLIQRSKITNI